LRLIARIGDFRFLSFLNSGCTAVALPEKPMSLPACHFPTNTWELDSQVTVLARRASLGTDRPACASHDCECIRSGRYADEGASSVITSRLLPRETILLLKYAHCMVAQD